MVGLVFVSHSARLAEGVREVVEQMVKGHVPLAIAAGIDDPDNPIGTDPMKVYEAIESVYSDDGVVVLMDLGSALLSAEMALELLEPERRQNVSLSDAPFVEGALAAAVQAFVGGTRQQVLAEACGSLSMKVNQLQAGAEVGERASLETGSEAVNLTIPNRMGLHARPAARFVSIANEFKATIHVNKGDKQANAKSIDQMTKLSVRQGEEIQVVATGKDAGEALRALKALIEADFGEPNEDEKLILPESADAASNLEADLRGIIVSPGAAVGPATLYQPHFPAVVEQTIDDPTAEWKRFENAVAAALQDIKALQIEVNCQIGEAEAAIFQAHALLLQDPALLEPVKTRIFDELVNAERSWNQAIKAAAEGFRALENPYLKGRAPDVEDVGRRVLFKLMGIELPSFAFAQPSILVAADLLPSDMARLVGKKGLGICLESGDAASHSAILARALGIPAIAGLGDSLWEISEGEIVAIDGDTGLLWLQPDEEQQKELLLRRII